MINKNIYFLIMFAGLISCQQNTNTENQEATSTVDEEAVKVGTLEVVAELDINPGNVAVSNNGKVFMSVHPLRGKDLQLAMVTNDGSYTPYPSNEYQTKKGEEAKKGFDTPLGIVVDKKDRLWIIDAGLSIGKARIFAFQVETGEELYRFEIPAEIAPKTSFVQDLAIDEENEWAYLADFGDPGLIALDITNQSFRKFRDSTMLAEDIDMVIDGKAQNFQGAPARIGVNPITLSEDRDIIYYGAMSGTKWYSVPAKAFRDQSSDDFIKSNIEVVGPKPICDGVATDSQGKHYFTNVQNGSIDVLENGKLSTLVKDEKINWPDNVRIGPDNWLYIAINQLHKSPAFTAGEDEAVLPYYILRVKI